MGDGNKEESVQLARDGHVAWVTLNRPDKRNAIDTDAKAHLASAFANVSDDPNIRVAVLTGAGSAFCSGVDLSSGDAGDDEHVLLRNSAPLAAPIEQCSKPVIAAVNGPAAGGGFELALAAPLRVAAPSAKFLLPEVRIGSLPGSGGTQRLFRSLPSAVAWKVLLGGEPLGADDALRLGLVSDVFDADAFVQEVGDLAASVAHSAPLSLRAATLAGRAATEQGLDHGLALERSLWAFLSTTEDRAEGRAAFREKRDPDYRGR